MTCNHGTDGMSTSDAHHSRHPNKPKATKVRDAPEAIPRTCCDARVQADDSASREAPNGMLRAERAPALFNNLPALAREAMAVSLCTTPALTSDVRPNHRSSLL